MQIDPAFRDHGQRARARKRKRQLRIVGVALFLTVLAPAGIYLMVREPPALIVAAVEPSATEAVPR